MLHILRRLTNLSVVPGAIALATLAGAGHVRAQTLPTDVFKMDRFTRSTTSAAKDLDGSVRISNPGSAGLRAWAAHPEGSDGDGKALFTTETPFQDAALTAAELDDLTEKCGDILDNGSGAGQCRCEEEKDSIGARRPGSPEPGTLCANLYVLAADQQLTECCACPVTPNGLLKLSIRRDLTSNPLTGDLPDRGVVALLSSVPGATGDCDPSVPTLPTSSTTTTVPTTTSTTTTNPNETTTTAPTTTTPSSTVTSTTIVGTGLSACDTLAGAQRLECALGTIGVDPACDGSTIKPAVSRMLARRMTAAQKKVQAADQSGDRAFVHALDRADKTLAGVERSLIKAAKRRRVTASCLALLQDQIGGARSAVTALR
ncbi:MAG TPA: hypothetical protein VMS22_08710 [Candidatus Eisenbacteria bacterium]|nr:hypothetical protein [Candidatus Eisenbacteria bacterium]